MIPNIITLFFAISLNSFLFCAQANNEPVEQYPAIPDFIKKALEEPKAKESIEKVRMFLEDDPRNVEATDRVDKLTLLMLAARSSTTTIIKHILDKRPDLNRQNKKKQTALMCGIIWNTLAAIKVLAQANSDLSIKDAQNRTPLELALMQVTYGAAKTKKKARSIHAFIEKETTKYNNTEQAKAAYETGMLNLNSLSLPEADAVTLQFLGDTEKMSAVRAKKRRKVDSDKAQPLSESVTQKSH